MPSKSIYHANALSIVKEDQIYFLRRNNLKTGGRRYYTDKQASSLLTSIIKSYQKGKFKSDFHLHLSPDLSNKLGHPELALEEPIQTLKN